MTMTLVRPEQATLFSEDDLNVSMETVTPELAAAWLKRNGGNRKLSEAVVAKYTRDILSGRWHDTFEALKFSVEGRLLDGQHRLHAIIRAGVALRVMVVRGVPDRAQAYMDAQKPRTAANALEMRGVKYANTVAAAARLHMNVLAGITHRARSVPEVDEHLAANPGLIAAAAVGYRLSRSICASKAVLAVAWHMLSEVDAEACEEFFNAMANAATDGPQDPRSVLLRRLISAERSRETLEPTVYLAFIFRTWNAWRTGKKVASLKARVKTNAGVIDTPIPEPV